MPWLRLNISNLCNFSCKHCHVFKIAENKLPKKLMSYETMDFAISNYIDLLKKSNQKNLTISIYGGETLLNKKNLFKVIEKYDNNHNGIEIYWIVNTNGSLLNGEDAVFLKKHNIDVHISCDGYAEIHNQNRIDKFGKGTFEKTEKALELAKKHNLKSQINSFMMPENINNLKDLVDIAKKYNIHRIYLDLFYSKNMLDSKKVVEKFSEAYSYGKKNNVKVHGPWSNILSNYLGNKKVNYQKLPSINVNVDDTFFFNMYPMTRKFNFHIKNLKKIISSKRYDVFLKSVNSYFNKQCKDCFLYNSCFGSAITQYQYHVIKKEGFEKSCEFTKEIISVGVQSKQAPSKTHINNTLYWNITNLCNLNCSFCELEKNPKIDKMNLNLTLNNLDKIKNYFKKLKGQWEFFIGGGEPFIFPEFLQLIKDLVAMGHKISIVTNFTSSLDQLKEFCKIADKNIVLFLASYKPEVHKFDDFLKNRGLNSIYRSKELMENIGIMKNLKKKKYFISKELTD